MDLHDEVIVPGLRDLRETRRRRRMGDWSAIDALYKAYVSGIVAAVSLTLLSGVVGDRRVSDDGLDVVRRSGPAAVGLVAALAILLSLRSGARGGPLSLEGADVRYVMLAPVDRDLALRPPALRQLRFASFAGSVAGAAAGLLAYRRLSGGPVPWVCAGAVTGAAIAVLSTGTAMVASGRRVRPRTATLVGGLVVAWSGADLAMATSTSPASKLGGIALWPLDSDPFLALALVLPIASAVAGLRAIGGISLEAAERRGRLITHLRFAATFQDLRTVMLLRRQLAAELPRARPWIHLRPAQRGPITWRRDWRGILRWPAVRVVRLVLLGILAGLAGIAAWSGTTLLIALAGTALYVAGLDAVEGLAEEIDHPDRRDGFPVDSGALHLRHLAAPVVVLVAVCGIAVAAAAAAGGGLLAVQVGIPLLLPAAAAAAGGAAVSTVREPPDLARLLLDSTGTLMLARHAFPPALATAGPAAALLVKEQLAVTPGASPFGTSAGAAVSVAFLGVLVFGWVRHREEIAAFFARARPQAAAP